MQIHEKLGAFYLGKVWDPEAGAVREIRRNLLNEHKVPAGHLVTRGYWKRATANHPDSDYGQD